jgi:Dyp-type peroxidase family
VLLLFLCFNDAQNAKVWLGSFAPRVTSFSEQLMQTRNMKVALENGQTIPGELFVNFMLSGAGYEFLAIPNHKRPKSSKFARGMASRGKLNDVPKANWESTFNGSKGAVHAAILLAHDNEKELQAESDKIEQDLQSANIDVLGKQKGKRRWRKISENVQQSDQFNFPASGSSQLHTDTYPPRHNDVYVDIEPFGYADGVSQPLFLEEDILKYQQVQYTKKFWDPSTEVGVVLNPDRGGATTSYGSYCVFRKLEQDVHGFTQAVIQIAHAQNVNPDLVGAQIIGRFKDGTPVALSDHQKGTVPQNNFNYSDDFHGKFCPLSAHIRKTNPRESLFNVRIARRGLPYEEEGDAKKEGLLFMSMQSHLKQFETIQNTWANSTIFPFGHTPIPGTDPIIGQPPSANQLPLQWGENHPRGQANFVDNHGNRFVTLKGGEYFFLPSLNALDNIATAM